MVIDLPLQQNIAVLSSYRVGSTALCDWLSQKHNLINLDEIFHPVKNISLPSKKNKKFIVKIMPDHYAHPEAKKFLASSFVISISRRDLVAQISSFYVCHMTTKWHRVQKEFCDEYAVPLDQFEIENQIRYILDMNRLQKELSSRYADVFYFYEDIKNMLGDSKFDIYHKPTNYKDINDYVHQWIAENTYNKEGF